jgi:RNA polymerase sigma factor (sigma-70 family)
LRCDCPPFDCAGLVRDYLAGRREAGDELIRHFTPLVRAIVQRVLGAERRDEWDDVCQMAFLRMLSRLSTWEQRCPFCRWLSVVAVRVALNWLHLPPFPPSLSASDPPAPSPASVASETLERIEAHAARWPPERRQLFDWLVQGVSREEMARRLNVTERTVYRLLNTMREELLICLEE